MILIKNQKEIDIMREAGRRHAKLMVILNESVKPGITTLDIELLAQETCKSLSLDMIQIGYLGYPNAICIGVNDDAEHCIPNKNKLIKNGDLVNIDCAVKYNGYCSDGGFTKPVGTVDQEGYRLVNTTKLALDTAVKACVEGNYVNDISKAIYSIAKLSGYNVLKNYTGHGIGKSMHEDPYIHNYVRFKESERLESGMTLALDTMITEGKGDVYILDDGWSTKTVDGKRFGFFEYTVLVGKDKPEILNQF